MVLSSGLDKIKAVAVFISLFVLCVIGPAFGQLDQVNNAVKNLASNPRLRGAQIGISLVNLKTGEIIASHQAEQIMIPASTQKLITTAAAMDLLGKNYKFKTELGYSGQITDGILQGNLILKGYGDPSFTSEIIHGKGHFNAILNNIVENIVKKGIKHIEGDVLADESYLTIPPEHATWQWMDLGNYYGSGAWTLNAHDNLFYITFKQTTSIGQIPEIIKIEPEIPGLILKNEITTALPNTGDNAYVYGAPFQDNRIIRGTIPAGNGLFTIKASIPHPAKFMTFHIIKSLESKGVTVKKQPVSKSSNHDFQVIETWFSPELYKLIQLANKESNNMICEALYHEIGVKMKNSNQKYDGKVALSEWLALISKTDIPFFIEDGSGLSMKNGVSPISMTSFLYEIQKIKDFDAWKSSLPIAGKEGTVKSIGKKITSASLLIKSGTISRVRCYAGYVQKIKGDSYVVCLMINQHGLRSSEIIPLIDTFFTSISK